MKRYKPGIESLLSDKKQWLAGKRVGLVSHGAAVDSRGTLSAQRLRDDPDIQLSCLFGPEHGFFGRAGAGERCRSMTHPEWKIPVHSLYGKNKKPTAAMLRGIDTLVFDIQDLGIRCYTYVSTLKLVLDAASRQGTEVIIADRPIPLPDTVDGPVTQKKFASFVALVDTPMVYGMTPGEAALWLNRHEKTGASLRVVPMQGYKRNRSLPAARWIPPSPSIRSYTSAVVYPATVCFEALGVVDHGRRTAMPFEVIGASWIQGKALAERINAEGLPGIQCSPKRYKSESGNKGQWMKGIQLDVTDIHCYQPIRTAISLVRCLQELYGKDRIWAEPDARPDFFDKLFGTDKVRKSLLDDEPVDAIVSRWSRDLQPFKKSRQRCLLYT